MKDFNDLPLLPLLALVVDAIVFVLILFVVVVVCRNSRWQYGLINRV